MEKADMVGDQVLGSHLDLGSLGNGIAEDDSKGLNSWGLQDLGYSWEVVVGRMKDDILLGRWLKNQDH